MTERAPDDHAIGHVPVGKPVSWAELFFDLVFVFAITEVSALLHSGQNLSGLLRALVVFVPIYWVWVGTSIRSNTREITLRRELALLAIALASLVMALGVPDAYRGRALLFALAYWIARLVLGSPLFTGTGFTVNVFTVSIAVTAPVLVIGAMVHGRGQEGLWATAAVIDLATPWVLRSQARRLQVDAAHLSERFGQFVLVALGESVVTIGAPVTSGDRLRLGALAAVIVAFALCCGLWWTYFQNTADAVRHALATASVQADVIRDVLSYGHLLLIASIIAVAVGLRDAVAEPAGRPGWATASLLVGGCSMYLATFAYLRWRMHQQPATGRLITAAAILPLIPLGRFLPTLVLLAMLAAVLAGLNAVEHQKIARRAARAHNS